MPRRRKTRESATSGTDAGESSERNVALDTDRPQKTQKRVARNRVESPAETEASASVSGRGRNHSRRKCRRLDTESSADKTNSSPANEVPASTDNRSNRESPEQGCSICLGAVENRAFTNACYHTFCFECLVEWSRIRAVCPLCKKLFHSIIHSFRSYDDYKLYQVPTSHTSNSVNMSGANSSSSSSSHFARVGRLWNSSNFTAPPAAEDTDHVLAFRRRVYTHSQEIHLRGLWSSDGVVMSPSHQVSPATFDCYPQMLERVRPWVLREIAVIVGNGDVQTVASVVLDLLRHFPISSEDFYDRLFPYLGLHTRRFVLELDAFARSPFDMTTYDARVVYSTDVNEEIPLRLHVEDISSSDDSDIEIVSPAVVSASDSAHNYQVSLMNDHVVPDLLHCFRTLQHNMLSLSLSFMARQSSNSGLESPVPGPSGLGQSVETDDRDGVASHTARSSNNDEERPDSLMVVSDADSDIMVVDDFDRSSHSPIHISSGEDDGIAEQIRTHRRRKKRRRRYRRARTEHRRELEQSDDSTNTTEGAVKNEASADVCAVSTHGEPHASGNKSADYSVESNIDGLQHAAGQSESSNNIQEQSSSRSSSVMFSGHGSTSPKSSPSKPYLHNEVGRSSDASKLALRHTHPKRSSSANSVMSFSVASETGTDEVKPLTCKKHVSGHKSSKQKARELVPKERSSEVVGDGVEKAVASSRAETISGRCDLSDNVSNGQNPPADAPVEVTQAVPSTGESSTVPADFSSIPLPVTSSSEIVTVEQNLTTGMQLDDGIPVPSTSEQCSLPVFSSSEDIQCSSSSRMEVCHDIASTCLSAADKSSLARDNNVCSGDVVRTLDAGELREDDAGVVNNDRDGALIASAVSSDSTNPGTFVGDQAHSVTEPVCVSDVFLSSMTGCLPPSVDLQFISDASVKRDSDNHNPESSSKHDTSQIQSVRSFGLENMDFGEVANEPLQNDNIDSLPDVLRESESVLFLDSSSRQDFQSNCDTSCSCTDAANSKRQSSVPFSELCSTVMPANCQSPDCGLTDCRRSVGSVSNADLFQSSAENLCPVTNDSIVIGSPDGRESSDSEVEWLETDVLPRQRCISISSGGSSIVYNPSDDGDIESVLSDSDGLEMFDDEPRTSCTENQSAESGRPGETDDAEVNSTVLPSTSVMASDTEAGEVEAVKNSKQETPKKEPQLDVSNTAEAPTTTNECAGNNSLHDNQAADSYNQDSGDDTDEYYDAVTLQNSSAVDGNRPDFSAGIGYVEYWLHSSGR